MDHAGARPARGPGAAPSRPAIARPVPPGEAQPAAASAPALRPQKAQSVKLSPSAETSVYEAECRSYAASMMKREGWVEPGPPPQRCDPQHADFAKQEDPQLCNQVGGQYGRECIHCGNNRTKYFGMNKNSAGQVRTFCQPPPSSATPATRARASVLRVCSANAIACNINTRSIPRHGPATSARPRMVEPSTSSTAQIAAAAVRR
jgi:hypothetical protein